jgi:hypothetical protein
MTAAIPVAGALAVAAMQAVMMLRTKALTGPTTGLEPKRPRQGALITPRTVSGKPNGAPPITPRTVSGWSRVLPTGAPKTPISTQRMTRHIAPGTASA